MAQRGLEGALGIERASMIAQLEVVYIAILTGLSGEGGSDKKSFRSSF